MDNTKKLKRGELLFKEGDSITAVYLIQSGRIGLMAERGGKRWEVLTVGGSQILADNGLFSNSKHAFTAEVQQETRYLELPLEALKQQIEKCPPGIKLILKSVSDDLRQARMLIKGLKAEGEKSPCPQALVHRIFTELHLIIRHIAKKDPANANVYMTSWPQVKTYATRFFGESPQRLRSLLDLLFKLQLVELSFAENEEGEKDLGDLKFSNIQLLEDFAEFFQYHLFKGSQAEAIYVDPLALKVAKAIYEISALAEVDHKGASRVEYGRVVNECKSRFHFELKNTHFDSLERKGLFVKRQSFDDGRIVLSFDRVEFGKMSQYWSILLEIDKWNEKGFVELNEKEKASEATSNVCPQCSSVIETSHKFCPSCGFKVAV